MLKIEFNNQILKVPSEWSDVCLSDYEKWFMHNWEDKAEYVSLIADICKKDSEFFLNSPTELFEAVSSTLQFIFDTEFKPSTSIKIKDQDYFISISEKLTLGEWIDIEQVLNSESETKISEILAIVCRPAGEAYNPEVLESRKEIFRNMPCDKVLPLLTFFLRKKKESEEILHHYSMVVDQANRFLKDTKTFVINGGGIKRLPIWQRIRYTYLTKSLEKQLLKYSDSSFIV